MALGKLNVKRIDRMKEKSPITLIDRTKVFQPEESLRSSREIKNFVSFQLLQNVRRARSRTIDSSSEIISLSDARNYPVNRRLRLTTTLYPALSPIYARRKQFAKTVPAVEERSARCNAIRDAIHDARRSILA